MPADDQATSFAPKVRITLVPPPGPSVLGRCNRAAPLFPQLVAAAAPRGFVDAMAVREEVFVKGCGVPAEYEMDEDDGRAVAWVGYVAEGEEGGKGGQGKGKEEDGRGRGCDDDDDYDDDGENGSEATTKWKAVSTIRLVPPPHASGHPVSGGVYVDGKLVGICRDFPSTTTTTTPPPLPLVGDAAGAGKDGASSFLRHATQEPYVKLGRLAVLPSWRGKGIASMMVREALAWLGDASAAGRVAAVSSEQQGPRRASQSQKKACCDDGDNEDDEEELEKPKQWNGLIFVHVRKEMLGLWQRHGFVLDDAMGTWFEEGMEHVGMFTKLPSPCPRWL